MNHKIRVEWKRNLIKCPSQIYGDFSYINPKTKETKNYCIYLRWRSRDPWLAYLVEVDNDGEFKDDGWKLLGIRNYTHAEYKDAESNALEVVNRMLYPPLPKSIKEKVILMILYLLLIILFIYFSLC